MPALSTNKRGPTIIIGREPFPLLTLVPSSHCQPREGRSSPCHDYGFCPHHCCRHCCQGADLSTYDITPLYPSTNTDASKLSMTAGLCHWARDGSWSSFVLKTSAAQPPPYHLPTPVSMLESPLCLQGSAAGFLGAFKALLPLRPLLLGLCSPSAAGPAATPRDPPTLIGAAFGFTCCDSPSHHWDSNRGDPGVCRTHGRKSNPLTFLLI